jgi:hypothetical protein
VVTVGLAETNAARRPSVLRLPREKHRCREHEQCCFALLRLWREGEPPENAPRLVPRVPVLRHHVREPRAGDEVAAVGLPVPGLFPHPRGAVRAAAGPLRALARPHGEPAWRSAVRPRGAHAGPAHGPARRGQRGRGLDRAAHGERAHVSLHPPLGVPLYCGLRVFGLGARALGGRRRVRGRHPPGHAAGGVGNAKRGHGGLRDHHFKQCAVRRGASSAPPPALAPTRKRALHPCLHPPPSPLPPPTHSHTPSSTRSS